MAADPVGDLAARLAGIVGHGGVLTDPDLMASYTVDWTGRWRGQAALVVRPTSTEQVAAVVAICAAAGMAMIPQGGNTGLVGGAVPGALPAGAVPDLASPLPVVISLVRLDRLEPVDVEAAQVTVGAGVTLGSLQRHLASSGTGLAFGVDLGPRDTATIGGMVATNAGGIHVIRYGGMRQQVAGIEAVLADSSVIARLDGLTKDNTGYDLAGLFTGSEGTLAIVTSLRLRLIPALTFRVTALIGMDDTATAVSLVARMRRDLRSLQAAELFYRDGLELVCRHASLNHPLTRWWPAYLLVECAGDDDSVLDELAGFIERAGVPDEAAAVAIDPAARAQLWALRDGHTDVVNGFGQPPHKFDVSLPTAALAAFVGMVGATVAEVAPSATLVLWGHVGDGNLHVNVIGLAPDDDIVDDAVLRLVASMGGSISAEHGIGRAKIHWIGLTRSAGDLRAMRAIKAALDPNGLFNPGVLLPGS